VGQLCESQLLEQLVRQFQQMFPGVQASMYLNNIETYVFVERVEHQFADSDVVPCAVNEKQLLQESELSYGVVS